MIIYLHGFDSNSPGNHEKVLQLQFIDPGCTLDKLQYAASET
ncbi:Predicted esterase [Escherichia coli]|uniref:Predicted esterase n=1 Tax=Escherichia coli TaxID=562 RepID=A0A376TIA7_ECOLX|nr:Predicted esterase [Escherichia coli]